MIFFNKKLVLISKEMYQEAKAKEADTSVAEKESAVGDSPELQPER